MDPFRLSIKETVAPGDESPCKSPKTSHEEFGHILLHYMGRFFKSVASGQGYHCATEIEINAFSQVYLRVCPLFTYSYFTPFKQISVWERKATL